MEFKFNIGTTVFFGHDALLKNSAGIKKLGKKAFIVTGKYSARLSGALSDVQNILDEFEIVYKIFDRIENNPSLENIGEASDEARSFKPDFIIGIGGGSPLDSSKAVAVMCTNNIQPVDLYTNNFPNKPLPIIAIPTTAGTGSEVTPYSILTRKDKETKMSFGTPETFPALAYIDYRYTNSLNRDVTIDTALDAFSHALEGYLTKRSTPVSDILASEAIEVFGQCIDGLLQGNFDKTLREKLMYVSMLGGMVISHTGTTIVHGMGYSLTYFKGYTHGRANGLLIPEYLKFIYSEASNKIDKVIKALKLSSIDEFKNIINELMGKLPEFGKDELEVFAEKTMQQRSTGFNIKKVSKEDIIRIYKESAR